MSFTCCPIYPCSILNPLHEHLFLQFPSPSVSVQLRLLSYVSMLPLHQIEAIPKTSSLKNQQDNLIPVSSPRFYYPELFRTHMKIPACAEDCTDSLFTGDFFFTFLIPLICKALFTLFPELLLGHGTSGLNCYTCQPFQYFLFFKLEINLPNTLIWSLL